MAYASGSGSCPKNPWSRRSAATSDSWKSPERETQNRWGRAAARTLPMMVGTGCRPSVTSPRDGGSADAVAVETAGHAPGQAGNFRLAVRTCVG